MSLPSDAMGVPMKLLCPGGQRHPGPILEGLRTMLIVKRPGDVPLYAGPL